MFPAQEILIKTKTLKLFSVSLNMCSNSEFKCELATLDRGSGTHDTNLDAHFHSNGAYWTCTETYQTAEEAFRSLIKYFCKQLKKQNRDDSITEIDNPCNTELLTRKKQQTILGSNVTVKVNGE